MKKTEARELAESIAVGWLILAAEKHGRMILLGTLAGQRIEGIGATWEDACVDFGAAFEARRLPVMAARAQLKGVAGWKWKLSRGWRIFKEAMREGWSKIWP